MTKNIQNFNLNITFNETCFHEVIEKNGKKQFNVISATRAADLLLTHSIFKYLKVFPELKKYYLYDSERGIYVLLSSETLLCIIRKIFSIITKNEVIRSTEYTRRVLNDLITGDNFLIEVPKPDKDYIVFKNGILCLKDNSFKSTFDPNIFVTSSVPYNYDPSAQCPQFLAFLHNFCNGYEDRIYFLRVWLYCLIHQLTQYQIFLVIYGPAATGKSTFANIASALIGGNATISTSLQVLNQDKFELVNLIEKKLILIGDSEQYSGDYHILKQLTGDDLIKGRAKYFQGNVDFYCEGMVLIITNHPLTPRDSSNALIRRMRVFLADNVINDKQPLLYMKSGTFMGVLSLELPGIFNWVMGVDKHKIKPFLSSTKEMVPSLSAFQKEQAEYANPLLEWIRDYIVPGGGSYVGSISKKTDKSRSYLYPAYNDWCREHGINPVYQRIFTNNLLPLLHSERFIDVYKIKTRDGIYIKGISLVNDINNQNKDNPLIANNTDNTTYSAQSPLLLENNKESAVTANSLSSSLTTQEADDGALLNNPSTTTVIVNYQDKQETVFLGEELPLSAFIYEQYPEFHQLSYKLMEDYDNLWQETPRKKAIYEERAAIYSDFYNPMPLYWRHLPELIPYFKELMKRETESFLAYGYQKLHLCISESNLSNFIHFHHTHIKAHILSSFVNVSVMHLNSSQKFPFQQLVYLHIPDCLNRILTGFIPQVTYVPFLDFINMQETPAISHDMFFHYLKEVLYSLPQRPDYNWLLDFYRQNLMINETTFKQAPQFESTRLVLNSMICKAPSCENLHKIPSLLKQFDKKMLIFPTGYYKEFSKDITGYTVAIFVEHCLFFLLAKTAIEFTKRYPEVEVLYHTYNSIVFIVDDPTGKNNINYNEECYKILRETCSLLGINLNI